MSPPDLSMPWDGVYGQFLIWLSLFWMVGSIVLDLKDLRRQRSVDAQNAAVRHLAALEQMESLRCAMLRRGVVAALVAGRRRRRRPRLSAELLGIWRGVHDVAEAESWSPDLHCRTCVSARARVEHAPRSVRAGACMGPTRRDA